MKVSDIPTLPRGVRLHFDRVRDSWVLLAPERAILLDPVGHAILNEVDGSQNFGEITRALAAKFEAPKDQVERDSAEFLDSLLDRRILDLTP
ncbi:MAG: pyrroloquinoline quinone biosynthesis peptide chaperone PqqD [Pseudomonadota bacterium]